MCIVLDTNVFASVFNETSKMHIEFEPVRYWITAGEGHAVYGGSKYKKELKEAYKYHRIFRLLKDARRAFEIKEEIVDAEETRLKRITTGTDCNDQHIIAIIIVSGCRLFCSADNHADKYIKNKAFYPSGIKRPLIYRNRKQKHLLSQKNIISLRNVIS